MPHLSISLPTVSIGDVAVALPMQVVANEGLIDELPKNQAHSAGAPCRSETYDT